MKLAYTCAFTAVLLCSQSLRAQEPAIAATALPTDAEPAPKKAAAPATLVKPKKGDYTGPTTVVELPPAPMLDEEGKQQLDLDGKPIFNAPVKQQRDKHGHPLVDDKGKPVFQTARELGYDETGHKIRMEKPKPAKMTPVSISRGTFTVDGMIAKAELNYEISDLKYLYLYVPGVGVTIVSNAAFPGAREEKEAFVENALTVLVADHTLQLASDKRLLDKKPESAFVLLDRDFHLPSKSPVVGYGGIRKAPYAWPGAKPNAEIAGAPVQPPPVPVSLKPVMLFKPCPAGFMRSTGRVALPGEKVQDQPCIPISRVIPARATPAQAAFSGSTGVVPGSFTGKP